MLFYFKREKLSNSNRKTTFSSPDLLGFVCRENHKGEVNFGPSSLANPSTYNSEKDSQFQHKFFFG